MMSPKDAKQLAKEAKAAEKAAKKAEKANSKHIDAMLAKAAQEENKVVKILLLGPGESGKSTLFKQIRKNYGTPPDELERRKHHIIVVQNVVRSIKSLLYHSERLLQRMPFSSLRNSLNASTTLINPALQSSKQFIQEVNLYTLFEGHAEMPTDTATNSGLSVRAMEAAGVPVVKLNPSGKFVPQILTRGADGRSAEEIFQELLLHCFLLWQDPGLKLTFENRAHFDFHQLVDSDAYFLDKLERGVLLAENYVPSDEDLIRVRIRTTALNTVDFRMRVDSSDSSAAPIPMRLLDVAGQRSERKKWIPYFQDATAVIFVAAISEYDQVLAEDGKTNRLLESIALFTEIMNSSWFVDTPLVLFLNKCDIFAEKLRRVPLAHLFPKYAGSGSYQSACEFLCREFVRRRANPNKVIHIHVVSAIQVDLIRTAMDSVKNMIVERSLGLAGLQ